MASSARLSLFSSSNLFGKVLASFARMAGDGVLHAVVGAYAQWSDTLSDAAETGTAIHPWQLNTPPMTSDFTIHRDTHDGRDVLVCTVGKTILSYDARWLGDLRAMLKERGEWVELGSADVRKDAKDGTVEAWAQHPNNPDGGWYGLKKGLRGRFGMYIPPLMERLCLAEVEHNQPSSRKKTP